MTKTANRHHPAAPKAQSATPLVFHSPDSSNVRGAEYDPLTKTCTVTFHHGGRYAHADMPPQIWAEFLNADSKGSFYSTRVKGIYACQKL